jgi:hypothetical protein
MFSNPERGVPDLEHEGARMFRPANTDVALPRMREEDGSGGKRIAWAPSAPAKG